MTVVRSPSPNTHRVTARKRPGEKRARILREQKTGQRVKEKNALAERAAARARTVLPGFAIVGELAIIYLPSKPIVPGGTIPSPDPIQSLCGLPSPSPITLLRTIAAYAAAGNGFNELAIACPLRVLIVTTRTDTAAALAKIVEDHALFPRERVTVARIGYDAYETLQVADLFRVARIAKPQIIFWECSLGIRELALPYIGDVRAAHVIFTDTAPIPAPAKPFHSCDVRPIVELQSVFDVKKRAGHYRIVGEDKKLRAAFTVADDGRCEPVPVKEKLNLKTRLSAARGEDIQVDEMENDNA